MIPATGVCAPARMLVAVRAIAPVAGNPPNIGEKILATPCPINSTFGLWRSLLIRSETTADMRDSIAPSIATVKAEQALHHARMPGWDGEMRQPGGNSTEPAAHCFHRQLQQISGDGRAQHGYDRPGDAVPDDAANQHYGHCACSQQRRLPRPRRKR